MTCGNDECAEMGYYVSRQSTGVKYLMTLSKEPYCARPIFLQVYISSTAPKTAGEIIITVKSSDYNETAPLSKLKFTKAVLIH